MKTITVLTLTFLPSTMLAVSANTLMRETCSVVVVTVGCGDLHTATRQELEDIRRYQLRSHCGRLRVVAFI